MLPSRCRTELCGFGAGIADQAGMVLFASFRACRCRDSVDQKAGGHMARDDRISWRSKIDLTEQPAINSPAFDEALLQRVYGEFLEMPGLRLTRPQAQRLLGLDESTCAQLLEWLVDAKFLCRPDDRTYMRLTDGYTARPRMAKAGIVAGTSRTKRKAV
jgi:hypothetical protein